jgi:hypothetical protein
MFTSHIETAIVVITLSRPQMATLVRNHRNQLMKDIKKL